MNQVASNSRPAMGCGGSKAVSITHNGSSASIQSYSSKQRPPTSKHDNTPVNALLPEVAVFGISDQEIPIGPVNNAKPRLQSGIIKGRQVPITPGLDNPPELPPPEFVCNSDTYSLHSFSNDYDTVKPNQEISNEIPTSFSLQPYSYREDQSPFNTSRTMSNSRAGSAKTGSILTTAAPNTSIVTSFDGDELDIPLGTPLMNSEDFDESSFRTTSITPSVSMTPSVRSSLEPTPIVLNDKQFGPIMEEYEGGFTPRSIQNGEVGILSERTRHYTYREIFEHNRLAGWNEWSVYKHKIYHNKRMKEIFPTLVQAARQKRDAEKLERREEKENKVDNFEDEDEYASSYDDSESDDNDSYNYIPEDDLEDMDVWNTNGVRLLLRNGLDKATLDAYLPPCCVGLVSQPSHHSYWDDIRNDVKLVLNDLIREDCNDTLSPYAAEYMQLLQRWIKTFRHSNPRTFEPEKSGNLNDNDFPLPDEIAENPECLRAWVETWEAFEFELPETGAWEVHEIADLDLGDPHEIFAASLRPDNGLPPLDMAVDGEAGWTVIPENLFADDVMTDRQKLIGQLRKERTDLFDPERMKRRRERLLKYFTEKYEMSKSSVEHFLNWAAEMEKGEREFLSLCNDGDI